MRKIFKRRRAVKACREFLVGYRCLTERGVARVEGAIVALKGLGECEKELVAVSRVADLVKGLEGFLSGTEAGFGEFEKLGTEAKLVEFVKRRGRV